MTPVLIILLLASVIVWAGSDGGIVVFSVPVMGWAVLLAFLVQWLVFIPAYKFQTERYYDLTGSFTYISVVLLALIGTNTYDVRSLLLALFIMVWAARLGSFLFLRISRDGGDSRFDRIKPSALLFFRTWTLQGLWVAVTAGAALAAITGVKPAPMSVIDVPGIGLWLLGFSIEVIADRQKRQFRRNHGADQFITTGLWSRSRHPNYFGEIMLWSGIALLAVPALQGWQYLTLVSPLFVYVLLTRVSGVVMLERKSDKRWGQDAAYREYKLRTPVLVPGIFR